MSGEFSVRDLCKLTTFSYGDSPQKTISEVPFAF